MLQRAPNYFELDQQALEKKRGRSGLERPKSREETPKEATITRARLAMSHCTN